MEKEKQYWRSRSGERQDIDEMTSGHVKNILKMIVRNTDQNRYYTPTTSQEVINSQILLEERVESLITDLKIKNKEYSELGIEEDVYLEMFYRRDTTLERIQKLKELLI